MKEIIAHANGSGKTMLLVRWGDDNESWQPEGDLEWCQEMLSDFFARSRKPLASETVAMEGNMLDAALGFGYISSAEAERPIRAEVEEGGEQTYAEAEVVEAAAFELSDAFELTLVTDAIKERGDPGELQVGETVAREPESPEILHSGRRDYVPRSRR